MKVGFAGQEKPQSIFHTLLGYPKSMEKINGDQIKDCYIGIEAYTKANILLNKSPFGFDNDHSLITNWDDMEKIWNYLFYDELHIDPSKYPVLLTEPLMNSKPQREKMVEIMFEKFHVPSLYIANQNVLSLYASGRLYGLVVECGDSVTSAVPIVDGYPVSHSNISRMNFGGYDLTKWMAKLLDKDNVFFNSYYEKTIFNDMKEKKTYVAFDYEAELKKVETSNEIQTIYNRPDGQKVQLSKERFQCPELLFKPSLGGIKEYDETGITGIHNLIYHTIKCCPFYNEGYLFTNEIILSGGSTMFDGLAQRLEKELRNLTKYNYGDFKVIAPPERKYSVWIGGSIFGSIPSFPQNVLTQDEYNQNGPNKQIFIHRKFPQIY